MSVHTDNFVELMCDDVRTFTDCAHLFDMSIFKNRVVYNFVMLSTWSSPKKLGTKLRYF